MPVKFTNNASSTLASGISNSATTITLATGGGALFPSLAAGEYFYGTLSDASSNLEIVKVTARSTDTLTVVRGQDGTTAKAYSTGDTFELRTVAAALNDKFDKEGGTVTGNLTVSGNSLLGTVTSGTWNGSAIGVAYGGTGKTTGPEALGNLLGYTSITASVSTVALTATSNFYQVVTGTSNQTITLPSTSTISTGWSVVINNAMSVTVVTVNSFDGTLVLNIPSGTAGRFYCVSTSVNTPSAWKGGLTDVALASPATNGIISSTNFTTFNNKQAALVSGTNIKTVNGTSLLGSGDLGNIGIAYGGTGKASGVEALANLSGFSTTTTSGAPLTLTNVSNYNQVFTGSTAQTVTLPSTLGLFTGWAVLLTNLSTATITVNTSLGNLVVSVPPNAAAHVMCLSTALNTASGWRGALTNLNAASSTQSGYLTSTDWSTFNSKGSGTVTNVSALTLGTTGTNLSSTVATGTTTPVITLNVPDASATARGALTSTDWSTFNNKQAALVSGTNIKTVNGTSLLGSGDLTVSGGATGGGTDKAFWENDQTISTNYTLTSGKNAGTFGPVTVASGITVTVPSGSVWTIV